MSHLLSIKIRVVQSNLVNLKSRGTRDLFDTSLQMRIHTETTLYSSHPEHVVGTQKNCLNKTVLLSTQNTCLEYMLKLMGKEIITIITVLCS